jgi:hypothetical protein
MTGREWYDPPPLSRAVIERIRQDRDDPRRSPWSVRMRNDPVYAAEMTALGRHLKGNTEREIVAEALAEHDAEREVAYQLEGLGYSPRVIRAAILDANGVDGYATTADYKLALVEFANGRRRHSSWRLPA